MTATALHIITADQDPTIGDIIPGALIYRVARTTTGGLIVSTMPCHRGDVVSLAYNPENRDIDVDQLVVCRTCLITYEVTPVPPAGSTPPRMVYRVTDRTVLVSRPARRNDPR